MKTLLTALAGAALLTAPLAVSAHDFGGGAPHGGFAPHAVAPASGGFARGGFTPRSVPAPAFGGGFQHGGFASRATPAPAFRNGFERGGFVGRLYAGGYHDGFRYGVGGILPALYWDAYLADPFTYGLEAAPFGYHWVQVGDQALLIQDGTGAVVQVVAI